MWYKWYSWFVHVMYTPQTVTWSESCQLWCLSPSTLRYHLDALLSHLSNHPRHIHYALSLHLLQNGVNGSECPCATHTPAALETVINSWSLTIIVTSQCSSPSHSPTVDHHGSLWWIVLLFDVAMEGQDGSTILRNTMIRKGGEMVLGHQTRKLCTT